jgi:hypothetical protein
MDIGEERERIIVEPATSPIPRETPAPERMPEPKPEPVREPDAEPVPA